jgi:myosin heavy subunit
MSTFDLANSLTEKVNTRWWEKREPEQLQEWQELKDPSSGALYYYNSVTKEVTWEKPTELMSGDELDQGLGWVWVDDDDEVFIPAKVLSKNKNETVVTDQNGRQRTISNKKKNTSENTLEPLKRSSLQRIVQDLVLLDSMEVPLILHNLKERFQRNDIYTNVGTILIAINPYCVLPLYGDEVIRQYAHRRLGEDMKPHTFNIAHEAFIGLRDFSNCQSIIISGESGSGKTVSTKHCLNYLTFMAGAGNNVADKIIETNPILEAIGNAKTVRNDNSSRFGKYMQLFFRGKQCTISGCVIKTYLLEKIRVVNQGPNERNFHIFYQILAGVGSDLQKSLYLDTSPKDMQPGSYNYLKSCTHVDSVDDKKDFNDMVEAFDGLDFSKEKQTQIFQIIIAILKIGNLNFSQDDSSYSFINLNQGDNERYLNNASKLLQVDPKALSQVFITKELRIKNQPTTIMKLNKLQAGQSRDAFAKFVYSYLFDWVVAQLNIAIGQPNDQTKFIGCLDIFGFEIFETNSFEQLCINYTNEILQQHFNHQTFKLEEQVYQQEQIVFKHIDFVDNQPMLDLISFKPARVVGSPTSAAMGILPQLDEELITVKGSDGGFLAKVCDAHNSNKVFQKHPKIKTAFIIKHYAGFVTYETTGFLEKNRDVLTEDCIDLLRTSTHPLVQAILPEQVSQQEKKASLGSQFRRQLDELMITLRLTNPSYIRCIKPNANKAAIEFSPKLCHEQLTYSGVYEATKIRKLGYPFRLQNNKFVDRYAVLFDNETAPGNNVKEKCMAIINLMKLNKENIQIGVSMVLYRAEEHKSLELHRNIKVRLRETHEDLARLVKISPDSLVTEGEKEAYFIELSGTIRAADEFRIKTPISDQARKLLDKYVEERMDGETKQQLRNAVSTKDKTIIEKVLRICEGRGYQTSLVRECSVLYEQICDCEMAIGVSITQMNPDFLTRSLDMYKGIQYVVNGATPPSVTQAQTLLDKINRAQQMLISALKSLNHEHLRKSIEFCANFHYNDPKVASAKKKYNQIMQLRDILTVSKKNMNLTDLKEGLAQAKDIGYECDLIDECRLLLWRCQRIEQEAEKALKTLSDPDVRAILRSANDVGYPIKTNKSLKRLKSLVDGPAMDYYNAQFECAKASLDYERAIALSQLVTLERVQNQLNAFSVSNFNLLKDPMTWGNEKWWGSAKYRADTMLSYNDAYVHAPITIVFNNMPEPRKDDLIEKTLLCYENIQKIMLCRNSKRLAQRREEILMIGADYTDIRDEIYIGLIKMITNNQCEVPGSVDRGFELFTLCLLTFPPSNDFLHYLYWFLLQPQYKSYVERWNMTFLLARIAFMHAVATPFWGARCHLEDMSNVINHCIPTQMWFYDQQKAGKDVITTYDDLKVKFSDPNFEEKAQKAYQRSKKAEKQGFCSNVIPEATKKAFSLELNRRSQVHLQRTQGVQVLLPTPEFAAETSFISQQISRPQVGSKTTFVDNDDDDDDDDGGGGGAEISRSTKITTKKKVKKGKDLPSPPVSLPEKKKKKVVQQAESDDDDDNDEPEFAPVQKKKGANKDVIFKEKNKVDKGEKSTKKKKKVLVQQSSDDDDEEEEEEYHQAPVKASKKKTLTSPVTNTASNKKPVKQTKLMFNDDSD